MEKFWSWGGEYIGGKIGDDLWTHNGVHVGRFQGDEIYGPDGSYLGEVRSSNRLITKQSKKRLKKGSFSRKLSKTGWVPNVNYVGNVMLAGYEDFPTITELEA